MTPPNSPRYPTWHTDRRVSIGLIAALLIQGASGLVWAGRATQRIAHMEERAALFHAVGERIARLETQSAYMSAALIRIERKLDNKIGNLRQQPRQQSFQALQEQ